MGIREWIIPQEKKYFEMLKKQAGKIHEAVSLLREVSISLKDIEQKRLALKKVEHEADEIVHSIFIELNRSLITPIDKEDISQLASHLDDVVDNIYLAVNRLYLYRVREPSAEIKAFADCLFEASEHINLIFSLFRKPANAKQVSLLCIKIHWIENRADEVLNAALTKLFKEKDTIKIIKLNDIYNSLEFATDKCEDVANIVQDVLIKYG